LLVAVLVMTTLMGCAPGYEQRVQRSVRDRGSTNVRNASRSASGSRVSRALISWPLQSMTGVLGPDHRSPGVRAISGPLVSVLGPAGTPPSAPTRSASIRRPKALG